MKKNPYNNLLPPLHHQKAIKEYKILKYLEQGEYVTTYLCLDKNLKRNCIIKEFTPNSIAYRSITGKIIPLFKNNFELRLNRFLLEAQYLAKFNHPNIVKIKRYFKANGTGYFVMEHEDGKSLRQILKERENQFEESEILSLIRPLCEGLAQLHNQSLIHRDIKPDNIIVRSNGDPILINFGAIDNLTSLNIFNHKSCLTSHYASIEQYKIDLPQGPWIDIYALGATLHEIIAGFPPPKVIDRIEEDDFDSIENICRGKYSIKLLKAIDQSLSLDLNERPKSINEFLNIYKSDISNYLFKFQPIIFKAINHFLSWAKPNRGLIIEEFVSFILGFLVIDLTWRLNKGNLWNEELFDLLIDTKIIHSSYKDFEEAGFLSSSGIINKDTIKTRTEEYAATYYLDRQEENWTYSRTRNLCAKNCIRKEFSSDMKGFSDLLEDIIDRYRGRIKRELEKIFY